MHTFGLFVLNVYFWKSWTKSYKRSDTGAKSYLSRELTYFSQTREILIRPLNLIFWLSQEKQSYWVRTYYFRELTIRGEWRQVLRSNILWSKDGGKRSLRKNHRCKIVWVWLTEIRLYTDDCPVLSLEGGWEGPARVNCLIQIVCSLLSRNIEMREREKYRETNILW